MAYCITHFQGTTMPKPEGNITKEYPAKGNLKQFRFEAATPFYCCKCNTVKKAKLIALINDDWEQLICNASYGNINS